MKCVYDPDPSYESFGSEAAKYVCIGSGYGCGMRILMDDQKATRIRNLLSVSMIRIPYIKDMDPDPRNVCI